MNRIYKWLIVVQAAMFIAIVAYAVTRIGSLNRQLDLSHQNLLAATDTIHEMELRNGEMLSWNASLIIDKKAIEQQLADERLDRKEIERQLRSRISSLTKTIAEFKMDTIVLSDTVAMLADSSFITSFRYSDDWTLLEGSTRIYHQTAETRITGLSVTVPITVGQTEDYQLFVHSANPHVTIQMMQNSISSSSVNDKAFRRLTLGVYAGMGFSYGTLTKAWDFGPQFGIGVNYRLW